MILKPLATLVLTLAVMPVLSALNASAAEVAGKRGLDPFIGFWRVDVTDDGGAGRDHLFRLEIVVGVGDDQRIHR